MPPELAQSPAPASGAAPAPATRTEAQIEAELASIDEAARALAIADLDNPPASGSSAPKPGEHDYEYEARRKGWKPEADYTGPEGKWVDAKTFVERGERFTKKLESEIVSLRSKIESFEGTKAQFRKFFEEQMAKRDKEHAEAISALRLQRTQAIREGDDTLALELEDRIDATKEQQRALKAEATEAAAAQNAPATTDPTNAESNPVLLEWIEDGNSWFQKDEVLTKHAIAVGNELRKQGEKSVGRVFMDKVGAQVRADFPRRFKALETATASRHSTTDGAGQGGTGNASAGSYNGKTERDLPAADLAIMRQFIREGLYTKEQFLKSYFSRNG